MTGPDDPLLTRNEVALIIRANEDTVSRMNVAGKIPRPVRVARRTLWPRSVILAWVAAGCPDRKTWEATQQQQKRRRC